jgi:hypothetical protein
LFISLLQNLCHWRAQASADETTGIYDSFGANLVVQKFETLNAIRDCGYEI